jgi:hypothetical protein
MLRLVSFVNIFCQMALGVEGATDGCLFVINRVLVVVVLFYVG